MTSDELIAKCREFALTPREGDADLDAMSAEEAADRGLFCAWLDRRDRPVGDLGPHRRDAAGGLVSEDAVAAVHLRQLGGM